MTKTQEISRQVVVKVADGMDVVDALRAVCGSEATDKMIDDLYSQLRQSEGGEG